MGDYTDVCKITPPKNLDELIKELHNVFSSDRVNVDYVNALMTSYKSNPRDWKKFAKYDPHRCVFGTLKYCVKYLIINCLKHLHNSFEDEGEFRGTTAGTVNPGGSAPACPWHGWYARGRIRRDLPMP